uniref:Bifunctional inhibitor/plant lipid transfer protein/seed storage helical domain-containing protein n=1 Tax=Setaria viridis TaxID=4556 RepID=A0A4U6TZ63_SETVI|nr:hypothetical protein SEVIR_7G250000v2 [Setaria viridis]
MMAIEVILRALVYVLVFTMLVDNQAWGEKNCYPEKESVKYRCMKHIKFGTRYLPPLLGNKCCRTVAVSDMVCICGILTEEEIREISSFKLVRVARDCGHPLPVGTKCGTWTVPPPAPPAGTSRAHP